MTTSPYISLIFVNYRSSGYLAQALGSLLACERKTDFLEVIVVNNDVSESDSLHELKKTFPFLLIESGGNIGFSRGNNLGAKSARGKILGFVNPDIIWASECLSEIVGAFDFDQKLGVLGMALLDRYKKPEVWSFGSEPSLFNLFCNNLFPTFQNIVKKEISLQAWVSGGALFIRSELFFAIGGFDEQFFLYFEDVDLCASARQRGFSVVRHSAFPLVHLGGQSQYSTQIQKKYFLESQKKYFEKHRPKWESKALAYLQYFFVKITSITHVFLSQFSFRSTLARLAASLAPVFPRSFRSYERKPTTASEKQASPKKTGIEKLLVFFIFFLPFQFALQPSTEIDLAVARVLAVGIFLWWSAESLFKKNFILPRPPHLFFFVAFLFWTSLSFFWAENTLWAWRKILFLLSLFPLFLVFYATFRDQRSRGKIFAALVNGATLVALVALLQFFSQWWSSVEKVLVFWTQEILPFFLGSAFSETVANYSSLLVNISGTTVLRASGFFPDPHIAALFFGMSLPIAFWLVMESAGSAQKYWCLCTVIIFLADLFTFSRGGYVGLIFGTSVFFLVLILRGTEWKKQIIKIGAGAIIIAAILMSPIGLRLLSSFSSDDGSKIERVRLWQEAIEFIPLRPVAGVGLGNYPLLVKPSANYREPFYAHNLFLDITLETGLVGLFFFAGFLFSGGLYAWRKWMQNKDLFALALFSSLVVFFTHSFFETPLFSVHILPLFLLLMAADLSLQDKGKV